MRELGLLNVRVVNARAEEYQTKNCFDTMIARAVASVDDLIQISKHLLTNKGQLLMMKSEVSCDTPLLDQYRVVTLNVPGVSAHRSLIIIQRD